MNALEKVMKEHGKLKEFLLRDWCPSDFNLDIDLCKCKLPKDGQCEECWGQEVEP